MMIKRILFLIAVVFPIISFSQKAGQECFPAKALNLVYDKPQVLSPADRQILESTLVTFSDSTSNQIAVVIVDDLCGMDKAQFAIELGELWGVGQAKEDNGIVVLIKIKTPESKGEAFRSDPDAQTVQDSSLGSLGSDQSCANKEGLGIHTGIFARTCWNSDMVLILYGI
jgi:hypothetical protein